MGDIKKKKTRYSKPKKIYDRDRIEEENKLIQKYGLKNKKEIWKAKSEISRIRRRAKALIQKSEEEKQEFFKKLNKMGLKVKEVADILALTEKDLLERRLQTIVFKKGLAKTPKQARQLIVHKYVLVNKEAINTPSFKITIDLEDKISLKPQKEKQGEKANKENGKE
jgi:small subunit ribosomal protein S4